MELISIGKFAKTVVVTPIILRLMHKTNELIPCHKGLQSLLTKVNNH